MLATEVLTTDLDLLTRNSFYSAGGKGKGKDDKKKPAAAEVTYDFLRIPSSRIRIYSFKVLCFN